IIPPEIIKARMMVLVDTSASMIYQFTSDSSAGGDSPAGGDIAAFCDNQIGTSFDCNDNVQCSVANGGRNFFPVSNNNNPSRMLATKLAMLNVINAHSGLIDFGLARYRENPSQCSNNTYCCNTVTGTTTRGRCTDGAITLYPRPPIS